MATAQNPIGLNGVDFVEYSAPKSDYFEKLFKAWGFEKTAHTEKSIGGVADVSLFQQGDINFVVNHTKNSFAEKFHQAHGPSICATGFRVTDAAFAFQETVKRGAKPYKHQAGDWVPESIPAIYGIGDSLIFFVDPKNSKTLYNQVFKLPETHKAPKGFGFQIVDHFTNNVPKGEMQKWCDFYEKVLNFRETKFFDIRGKDTGLLSKVMRSPDGKFAVPINEPSIGKSQIQEYLDEYKGSGIQHVALLTPEILPAIRQLRSTQVEFLAPPPETYYKMLKDRLPMVNESIAQVQEQAILIDGDHDGYLLQIFSKNLCGPIFFEVIQRKGHEGFGEGNFQALFDAIEQDQRERGYL